MGIEVEQRVSASGGPAGEPRYETRLTPPQPLALAPLHLTLPGDFSSAAFLIVAALITPGSEITIQAVGLNPTRTGLLEALVGMGAEIAMKPQPAPHDEPVGDLVVRHSALRGRRVSGELVVRMIDEFPAFACAAAFGRGRVEVCDAEELHHKESDRIAALCLQLRQLEVDARETPDGFIINGHGQAGGGAVDSCGDHRLAMSLAAAGLASKAPITVQNAEIFTESFPGFVESLRGLGARIESQAG
jgi:3-phosphoshikimate 1-carboxyvinyltransferase